MRSENVRFGWTSLLVIAVFACGCGSSSATPDRNGNGGSSSSPGGTSGVGGGAGGNQSSGGGGAGSGSGSGGVTATGGSAGSTSAGAGGAAGSGAAGAAGHPAFPYILGADISFVQEEEDRGVTYADGGQQKDVLQLLKDHGFNYIRLRIFNNPGDPAGYQFEFGTRAEPYCDLAHTLEMAQRVKAAGMGLLLDFHYSDTWADPDDQNKPAAWANLGFTELVTAVHDYTRDTLVALRDAGALPDMVQVGNEITPGMLHPDGHTYDPENWDELAQLLTAGLSAVKEVDPGIKTMLHLDRGGDNETTIWWVGEALERGVSFDVLGESCYTNYHGEPPVWQANFADLVTRYPNLSFVIAEYSTDKREANDIMRGLPDGRGLGTFIWEPTTSGDWGEAMFTGGNAKTAIAADFALYDQMATDYGLR